LLSGAMRFPLRFFGFARIAIWLRGCRQLNPGAYQTAIAVASYW
jgi:hypothetical protein